MIRYYQIAYVGILLLATVALPAMGQATSRTDLDVASLKLDRSAVVLGCSPGQRPLAQACNDDLTVRATGELSGTGAKLASLEVTVTGGRSRRVSDRAFDWDLTGATPGTYTMTMISRGSDGRYGGSKTAMLKVEECRCGYVDACASLSVTGPTGSVEPGNKVKFSAQVSGAAGEVSYNWTVSAGTIETGQGTSIIEVSTDRSMAGMTLTATVHISDSRATLLCETTKSETAVIDSAPVPRLHHDMRTGGGNCEEAFAIMDSFYIELANNPADQGAIIVYTDKESPRSGWWRRRTLANHLKMRNFDPQRVTFIDGPVHENARTEFWIVPPGASQPEIKPGEAFKPGVSVISTAPYMYAARYSDGIPGCDGNLYDLAAYAEVLNSEPKSRGRVIISETSQARYQKERREILAELARNRVKPNRIITIFRKVAKTGLLESTELWVIPRIKK